MNKNEIWEALIEDALYTYEFDVTTGIVHTDIVCKDGSNLTQELGMKAPCSFDEMVKRSFGDFFRCQYIADFQLKDLSSASLLDAWKSGKRKLEVNLYRGDREQYVRLTYYLYCREVDAHIYAFVICEDITDLEKGKGRSFDLDNQNLKVERQTLTDDLDYQNNFTRILMEQMKCGVLAYSVPDMTLLHVNNEALRIFNWENPVEAAKKLPGLWNHMTLESAMDSKRLSDLRRKEGVLQYKFRVHVGAEDELQILAESKSLAGRHNGFVVISTFMDVTQILTLEADKEKLTGRNDVLTREKRDLTEERDTLTREKYDLTEERDTLTQEKKNLTEERDTLTREKNNLTEERDNLTQEKKNLTEERDTLTQEKKNLTEERDTLTREKNNLTEERDNLTQEKKNLTEERDTLTQEKKDLTEERDTLTREKNNLTEERDTLTQEKKNLTEERDTLTQEKKNLTEERDTLTREKKNLTEERDTLTREKNDLAEERDTLTREKNNLTEERDSLSVENTELNQAVDAVHAILRAGYYVCTYNASGDQLKEIKYSEALRKLYGYFDEQDFPDVWESWINCIVPEDREYVQSSYENALKDATGNTLYDVTYRSRRKDGEIRWQRAAGYVLRRPDGTPITCYGLVMDVDEQKKAADEIEKAMTQAQIANAAKTSFLARMSHDIRTPMNGILGLIEINEKHADELDFTARNRKKAKVAANYLLSLINDVLQLSKLEDPEVTLSYEAFNVKELAADILTIIKMRAVENGITLEYDERLGNFRYPYIWGSPLHVRQIFINILSNSIKYNKKNGKIWCKAECEKYSEEQIAYKITIYDNGIGMSKEFLEHLFEPFSREHTGVNSSYEGTGLGMSIVKQLVEKMEGSITVQSEEGKGSCFTVTLPFKIAEKKDINEVQPEMEAYDISGAQVLLVEDNELNMEIAETFLRDAGVIVTKAFNGQQAAYLFEKSPVGKFDVILMDVMMPVMNGYEATRKIRQLDRPDARTVPIIAMTANAFVEDIKESEEAGMNEHMSKPLDIKKVISIIGKYLDK